MIKKIALAAVFAALVSSSLLAAPWISHNSRRAPKNLIVVGNYKTPRLMAATIKGLTSQPYLIITNDGQYFMVLSKATVRLDPEKLDVYINQLNPRRLVIIGDERYVTDKQEAELRKINTKRIPIVRVYGGDWGRIAEELDDMLNIGNLAREFRRNYADLMMSDPRLSDPAADNGTASPKAPAVKADEAQDAGDEMPASEPEPLNVGK
jgi:hypothetical protein